MKTGWEEVRSWCACGGSFSARSTPAGMASDAVKTWRRLHVGDDCHPVDQDEHRRIAARLRRAEARKIKAGRRGT